MGKIDSLIALARAQVGTAEQPAGSNNVIYNTDYYGGPVSGDAYPWCCAFIWWLFWKLGRSAEFCGGQKTAFCPFVVNWAGTHGQWVTGGYRPGDLALFDWNGDGAADHIGIVVSVAGASVTTIEGNAGDAVREMQRSEVGIMGAYRPDYGEEGDPSTPPDGSAQDDRGSYTVKSGDTLWGIAETFLGSGARYTEIMELNGLTSIIIYPGQQLHLPGFDGRQTITVTVTAETYETLRLMAEGWGKTIGETIDEVVKAL